MRENTYHRGIPMRTTIHVEEAQRAAVERAARLLRKQTGENWSNAKVWRLVIELGLARTIQRIEEKEHGETEGQQREVRAGEV